MTEIRHIIRAVAVAILAVAEWFYLKANGWYRTVDYQDGTFDAWGRPLNGANWQPPADYQFRR